MEDMGDIPIKSRMIRERPMVVDGSGRLDWWHLFGLLSAMALLCMSARARVECRDGTGDGPTTVTTPTKMTAGPKLVGHERGQGRTLISTDGSRVATFYRDHGLDVFDGASGRLLLHVKNPHGNALVGDIGADATFRRFLTTGVIRHRTLEEIRAEPAQHPWCGAAVMVWDTALDRRICDLNMSDRARPAGAAIRPDGLAVGCMDSDLNVKVWDLRDPETVRLQFSVPRKDRDALHSHTYAYQCYFSRNLGRVVAVERDTTGGADQIYACDLPSGRSMIIPMPPDVAGQFEAIALNPDGTEIVAWVDGKKKGSSIRRFDFATGKLLKTLPSPDYKVVDYFDYAPDGGFLVIGSYLGRLSIRDLQTGTNIFECEMGEGPIRSVAVLGDRIRVLWGDGGNYPDRTALDPSWKASTGLRLTDVWIRLHP